MVVCGLTEDHIATNGAEAPNAIQVPYLPPFAHIAVSAYAQGSIYLGQSDANITEARMLFHDQMRT